jgi:hypothetical protein
LRRKKNQVDPEIIKQDDIRVLQLKMYQVIMEAPDRMESCDLVNTLIMLSHDMAIAKMGSEMASQHLYQAAVQRWPSVLSNENENDEAADPFEDYFVHEPVHSKKKH